MFELSAESKQRTGGWGRGLEEGGKDANKNPGVGGGGWGLSVDMSQGTCSRLVVTVDMDTVDECLSPSVDTYPWTPPRGRDKGGRGGRRGPTPPPHICINGGGGGGLL